MTKYGHQTGISRMGVIDVSSNDNFGLELEININASNNFDAAVAGMLNMTQKIM